MKGLTPSFEFALKNLFIISILFVTYSAAVNQLDFDGGNYIVTWNYSSASQEIEFEVRAKVTGYVALGLTKTNSAMKDLDLFIGGVNGGTNYLKDYKASGTGNPPEDPQQDYTLISASESNGVTTVRCKRKLNTGDANDQQIQPGDSVYIAWAYHTSSDNLLRHSSRGYSQQMQVLVPAIASPSPSPTATTTSVVQESSTSATVTPTTSQGASSTVTASPSTSSANVVQESSTSATVAPTTSQGPSPTATTSPTNTPISIVYNQELALNNGDYLLFWKYDSNIKELFFKLVVKAAGYVALGISKINSNMMDMDVVVAGVSGGQAYIGDYYSTGKETPPRDATQDYTLRTASESGQTTTVEFKRKINTGDDKDLQIVAGESYYLAWAYHVSSDSLSYHSQKGYSQKVVLAAAGGGPTTSPTTQRPPNGQTTTAYGSTAKATCSVAMIILSLVYAVIVH